ncbi:hypothetical protein JHK82_024142 [Glycine max]|nr:hypothetical protein JHK86_024228 [Glycine max]KAG5132954.1 hypothetical protein JHK82_024142 [Glycine max]
MGSLENNGAHKARDEKEHEQEPILMEQSQRFCMFPICYKQIWEMYKKVEANFEDKTISQCIVIAYNLLQKPLSSYEVLKDGLLNEATVLGVPVKATIYISVIHLGV